jgi:hypothetical protein
MLTCDCGCGETMLCYTGYNNLYINFCTPYTKAYTRSGKHKTKIKVLTGNPKLIEFQVTKEELDNFIAYLRSLHLTNEIPKDETAKLKISKHRIHTHKNAAWIKTNRRDTSYYLELRSKLSKTEILRGDLYKCYDLSLNQKQVNRLIKQLTADIENAD